MHHSPIIYDRSDCYENGSLLLKVLTPPFDFKWRGLRIVRFRSLTGDQKLFFTTSGLAPDKRIKVIHNTIQARIQAK